MVDLLLVDDIQFLEGKERTQEEFFHTFNALHPKSQLVITSDRPPKKIPTLEERLRTRFEWGLITDIQPPDLETRLAILQMKAEDGEPLRSPGRPLLHRLSDPDQHPRARGRPHPGRSPTRPSHAPTSPWSWLRGCSSRSSRTALEARVTSDLVISVSADYFDVTPDEICSSSRSRPLVTARQMAMYLCRELTDLSFPKIGERFGGRDHSTVIYANNKVRELMQERQSCYEQVRELTTRIRQQASPWITRCHPWPRRWKHRPARFRASAFAFPTTAPPGSRAGSAMPATSDLCSLIHESTAPTTYLQEIDLFLKSRPRS